VSSFVSDCFCRKITNFSNHRLIFILFRIFFRFVLLEDCNHIIESQALDQHLSTTVEGGEIVMKVCPLCKTPIKKTLRYMNFVKETYIHIMNVKNKIFGENNRMKTKKQSLIRKLQELNSSNLRFFSGNNFVYWEGFKMEPDSGTV